MPKQEAIVESKKNEINTKFKELLTSEIILLFEYLNYDVKPLIDSCQSLRKRIMKFYRKSARKTGKSYLKKYSANLPLEKIGIKIEDKRCFLISF